MVDTANSNPASRIKLLPDVFFFISDFFFFVNLHLILFDHQKMKDETIFVFRKKNCSLTFAV